MSVSWRDHRAHYRLMKDEIDEALLRVLDSGQYVGGPEVTTFEREFSEYCGAAHGISVHSGSDAILVSLLALDIGPGDEVIMPANGCPSIPVAVAHTGAEPVFVDIDRETYNVDLDCVQEAISGQTKAVLPVHSYGLPCDMEAIREIAETHDLAVIEDASLAVGATYDGQRVGGLGTVGVFSLGVGKILTAFGSGGIIVTDSRELAEKMEVYRHYGFRPLDDSDGIGQGYRTADGQVSVVKGYNSHLDALQAAVLRIRLQKLDRLIAERRRRAGWYDRLLEGVDVVRPKQMAGVTCAYRGYPIRVRERDRVLSELHAHGIDAKTYYLPPLHMEPLWRSLGHQEGDFPVTEGVAKEVICLPLYPELLRREVEEVVEVLGECVADAV